MKRSSHNSNAIIINLLRKITDENQITLGTGNTNIFAVQRSRSRSIEILAMVEGLGESSKCTGRI